MVKRAARAIEERMPDYMLDGGMDDIEAPTVAPTKGNVLAAMPAITVMVTTKNNHSNTANKALSMIEGIENMPTSMPTAAVMVQIKNNNNNNEVVAGGGGNVNRSYSRERNERGRGDRDRDQQQQSRERS
mmetsp:Transcript_7512/g.13525  ORF Transcript_7512/g.13525 Transcript_7512/m.13525 type:complete len:130 (-) Transcript_7512:294-683(-)